MSYYSRLNGSLTIAPPLRWGEYKDSPHLGDRAAANHLCLKLTDHTVREETEDGVMERRFADQVSYAFDRAENHVGDCLDELQALVDSHPEHQFLGEFEGEGNDFGDLWRLRVSPDTRKVERILPRITWPDGTETTNRHY